MARSAAFSRDKSKPLSDRRDWRCAGQGRRGNGSAGDAEGTTTGVVEVRERCERYASGLAPRIGQRWKRDAERAAISVRGSGFAAVHLRAGAPHDAEVMEGRIQQRQPAAPASEEEREEEEIRAAEP